MSRTTQEIRELLSPLDPSADGIGVISDTERDAALGRILAVERRGRPRRRRLVLATAAAIVVAIVAVPVVLVTSNPAPAHAATPPLLTFELPANPPTSAELLEAIAVRTAALPAEPRGDYQHLTVEGWYLWSQVDKRGTTSAVVPQRTEFWLRTDGSGRRVVRTMEPRFASESDREQWRRSRLWGLLDLGFSDTATTEYKPGEFHPMWSDPAPSKVDALRTWLEINHPVEIGPAEVLVAATDLLREQVLQPAQRASLLRVLASLPGLRYLGETTDRAGRSGTAFALDSNHGGLPNRRMLIVDPHTGRVLASEEMLTTTAGMLNVPIPSVISYETYLVADYSPPPR